MLIFKTRVQLCTAKQLWVCTITR